MLPALPVLKVVNVAGTDILADQELVTTEVLEDDADALAQGVGLPLLQIEAIEQDAAGVGR